MADSSPPKKQSVHSGRSSGSGKSKSSFGSKISSFGKKSAASTPSQVVGTFGGSSCVRRPYLRSIRVVEIWPQSLQITSKMADIGLDLERGLEPLTDPRGSGHLMGSGGHMGAAWVAAIP